MGARVRACVLACVRACVRACMFRALDDMKLGLSGEEAHQVVLHLEREGHMKDWRVSIKGFLDVHGGDEAKRATDKLKSYLAINNKKETFLLKPPDRTNDIRESVATTDSKWAPQMVFWLGFLICPIWCIGWIWINSKEPASRRRGRCSVLLSLLGMLSAIGVAAFFVIKANNLKEVRHCTASQGLLIAVKVRGPSANLEILGDYQVQFQLKGATHLLWYGLAFDKSLAIEDAIFIDEISRLDFDNDGATVKIIIRLSTTDSKESEYETPHVLLSPAPTKRIRMVAP
jgi:hypothetical protein